MSTMNKTPVKHTPRDVPPFEPLPLDECNLFIKYLPASVDDAHLRKMFEPYGSIVSCKVMMHPQRNTSLGYGFVRFAEVHEADAAVHHMNGIVVQNKIILVRKSNSESSRKHAAPSSVVYVSPIPVSVSAASIAQEFARYGAVQSCRLYDTPSGDVLRRIAFISYGSVSSAQKAIDAMDGGVLRCGDVDETISVRFAYKKKKTNEKEVAPVAPPRNTRNPQPRPPTTTTVVLPPTSNWASPSRHVDNTGLVDALSMLNVGTRYHYGQENIEVNEPPPRIQIVGICNGVSKEELVRILRPYGEIERLDFVYDSGFCVVSYRHHHEAVYAMRALHGLPLGDDVLAVTWDM